MARSRSWAQMDWSLSDSTIFSAPEMCISLPFSFRLARIFTLYKSVLMIVPRRIV